MAPTLQRPFSGGPLDDVIFFVDQGTADAAGSFDHPFLAQAALDGSSLATGQKFDIQPLAEEVEDFQVAYGIDGSARSGPDANKFDLGVDPTGTSAVPDGDEWVYDVAGDTALPMTTNPITVPRFLNTTIPGSTGQNFAVAALRSVRLAIVAKTLDPEAGAGSQAGFAAENGFRVFDSAAAPIGGATSSKFRRRVQTIAVSLRNYQ